MENEVPPRDLTDREKTLPMAHENNPAKLSKCQLEWRERNCLLKGCGRKFLGKSPLSRYCSEKCVQEARDWSEKRARERYCQTENGKAHRRKQSQEYRQRNKQHGCDKCEEKLECEGDHYAAPEGNICGRPGCYNRVIPTRRSPCKKYCSQGCSLAMRCVLERERRWRERFLRAKHKWLVLQDNHKLSSLEPP